MILVSLCLHRLLYTYFREMSTTLCFCKPCVLLENNSNYLETEKEQIEEKKQDKLCQNDSWKIGDLVIGSGLKYPQPSTQTGRTDVNPVTNWNVPLVWEGTFDPLVIDEIYKKMDPRVAVVVFAVGKYTRFLKAFIETGEKFFLVGFKVTYYIHTDNGNEVPKENNQFTQAKTSGVRIRRKVACSQKYSCY
ncbi:hypothetical protein AMECASPLE_023487 [Ameca splendens]|uniref:Uncharacterized protein n=1 Tax=Ameca splendens TaxID=208324 RepID=A0ABV0YRA1_9TELE